MKTSKVIYTLSAALLMGLSSCGSDFLDTPTDSRVELDSPEKLRLLLVTSYPQMNYAWPCEIMSDNIEDNNAPDEDGLRYNLGVYDRGDEEMFRWETCISNTANDSPSGIWESSYNAIAGANAVLEVIEKWEKEGPLTSELSAIKERLFSSEATATSFSRRCSATPTAATPSTRPLSESHISRSPRLP